MARTVVTNKHHVDQVVADYSALSNKPQINSVTLTGNKTGADLGLLTVEVDPTVPAWAKESTKPSYNYDELEYLPQINNVTVTGNKPLYDYGIQPAGNYLTTETDPTVPAWAKAATKPAYSYNELTDSPQINGVTLTGNKTESDLRLNEEVKFRVKASGNIVKGDICQINGGGTDYLDVVKATGALIASYPQDLIGVASSDIADGSYGYAVSIGIITGIDTSSAAGDGTYIYYDRTNGGIRFTRPANGNDKEIIIGIVLTKAVSGSIRVNIDAKPVISSISDVTISNIANGQFLQYNSSSNRWENVSPPINKTYTLTIDVGEWTANSYAQVISGLTDNDLVMIQAPDSYYSIYGLSYTQSGDTITFTVTSTPLISLVIGIGMVKCSAGGSL